MKRIILTGLLVGLPVLAGAAAQQRDRTPPPAASGRIAGTIVDADSGRPVRFAAVSITASSTEMALVTGDDGAFSFDWLPAGSYTLRVSKRGYLDTAYGQSRPGTDTVGRRIALANREAVERLVIPLSHGGSVSGVVRDDHGDPIYKANVRVSRWVMRNGARKLETVDSVETDERGRYRVALLPPREYVVSVLPSEDAIPEGKEDKKASPAGFAPIFYPSSLSARGAETLALGLGEDRGGIDLQLKTVRLGRVTGLVLGADGRPAPDMPIVLIDPEHADVEHGSGTDPQGRFVFEHLVPGTYVVHAGGRSHAKTFFDVKLAGDVTAEVSADKMWLTGRLLKIEGAPVRMYRDGPQPMPEGLRGTAVVDVAVASGTTTDTVLTLVAPRVVRGRVVVAGAAQRPPMQSLRVVLDSDELQQAASAQVAADGTFELPNVTPGKWQVSISELPGWTLGSALASGADVLDTLLDVPRDRDVPDLTLTLTDRFTEVFGTVTDTLSKPVADGTVILFPADERLWIRGANRVQANALQDDGRFRFDRIRPGAYRLALAESVEPDEWLDPQFLKRLLPISVPVSVAAGDRTVQDLRVK
jgi:hypothetical protein